MLKNTGYERDAFSSRYRCFAFSLQEMRGEKEKQPLISGSLFGTIRWTLVLLKALWLMDQGKTRSLHNHVWAQTKMQTLPNCKNGQTPSYTWWPEWLLLYYQLQLWPEYIFPALLDKIYSDTSTLLSPFPASIQSIAKPQFLKLSLKHLTHG